MNFSRLLLTIAFTAATLLGCMAQTAIPSGQVDVFMGLDLNYRDIYFKRVYDVLLNLTPGARWNVGRGWQVAGSLYVPVVNHYGRRYRDVRIKTATLSKEVDLMGDRLFIKGSAGVFTQERYGLDVKAMYLVTPWLALEAQAGLTGHAYLPFSKHYAYSTPGRLTGTVGADVYLTRWDTQARLRAGRFIYTDNGVTLDVMRHFRHVTVGVFGQHSDRFGNAGGFQFTAMLPPYTRPRRRVCLRPASSFKFSYINAAESYGTLRYLTDPEENDRQGWFDTDKCKWGVNATHTDYIYKDKKEDRKEVAE